MTDEIFVSITGLERRDKSIVNTNPNPRAIVPSSGECELTSKILIVSPYGITASTILHGELSLFRVLFERYCVLVFFSALCLGVALLSAETVQDADDDE